MILFILEYKHKLTENIFQRQKLKIAELITKIPITNKSREIIMYFEFLTLKIMFLLIKYK